VPQHHPDPQVVPYLLYADADAAMDWLIKAFGFTERVRDTRSDGTVRHGELLLGNGGVIMLGSPGTGFRGPAELGEVTQLQCVTVTGSGPIAHAATQWTIPRATAGTSASPCSPAPRAPW
jgi:uncharacterized glyoxalase superfamily protein PhnB